MTLTRAEKQAIRKLQTLAAAWPPTLWLYSANGKLTVMRFGPDGKQVMDGQGFDQTFEVGTIDGIVNEGGDW